MLNQLHENCKLLPLTEKHIPVLYRWNLEEKHFEYYTCRPLKLCDSLEEYTSNTWKAVSEKKERIHVLVQEENYDEPLGKVRLFDINTRNHSAEFGYYLPFHNRGQGLGSVMLSKFMQISFQDEALDLNKIYATTSSINHPSIGLLEKHGFSLDGSLREHYWINGNKYNQLVYSILRQEWEKQEDNT